MDLRTYSWLAKYMSALRCGCSALHRKCTKRDVPREVCAEFQSPEERSNGLPNRWWEVPHPHRARGDRTNRLQYVVLHHALEIE